ncbi:membrane glycoprotein precursor [Vibrio phage VSK]|uniref:Membrane glycoprotein n=1 Tax=Vibrio phage VSK TaxID=181604 RepID=Q8W6D5_9VIRU|nr:membrane glycoprotein precursor [Vibrio phage VSK]AAL49736.1 membrane glycoprotein precursor [Vibrio phage VSK]
MGISSTTTTNPTSGSTCISFGGIVSLKTGLSLSNTLPFTMALTHINWLKSLTKTTTNCC